MPGRSLAERNMLVGSSTKKAKTSRKDLIFAITGSIFHNGLLELYQGDGSRKILKQKRNNDWLLIRKRQNSMKKSRQENARREIWRILSAYFFGYWRTSDQNARRMSPFLTECEI